MKRPRTHRLTKYIKVLGKQNSCNTYAACIACFERLESSELSRNTFTNKKLQVKNHLKNCPYFREKIGNQEELDDIINLTDNEIEEEICQKRKKVDNEFEETGSVKSFGSFASTTSSARNFNSKNTIKNNLIRTSTKSEIPKFERLLLRMSVANGEILIWEASDISSERERLIEVIPKITGLIQETKRLGIKLNAIVSDSVPAYDAARRRLRLEYAEIVFLPSLRNLAIHYERPQIGSGDELYLNSELCQILLDNDWTIFDILL
ncbi:unnamed protein product [Rhizophagus irregularis]|uniref:DUF659 domain-containing protein n=1 Tax=Rhizophagus irregularis TaxID=588596 RepID=A0A915YNW9_9GLOM|nr:unnamed protein product [Rhizophagus irregularis]